MRFSRQTDGGMFLPDKRLMVPKHHGMRYPPVVGGPGAAGAGGGGAAFDGNYRATFESGADLDVYDSTSPTGTLAGATVSGGGLVLNGTQYVYWDPTGGFVIRNERILTVNLLIEPAYSNAPATQQRFFYMGTNASGFAVRHVALSHETGGGFRIWVHDGSGIVVNYTTGAWNPVSGTTYEIELNMDLITGATRLFIDGTQLGTTQTGTSADWLSAADYMSIGDVNSGVNVNQNFTCYDMKVWNTIQHTADY